MLQESATRKWTIRKANESDISNLSLLAIRTFKDTFHIYYTPQDLDDLTQEMFSVDQFTLQLAKKETIVLVVEASQGLVAYAQLDYYAEPKSDKSIDFADSMEIKRFYVDKEFFGTGLAQELMAHSLDLAAASKSRAWLGVFVDNARAKKFYSKFGFERVASYLFSEKLLVNGLQDIDEIWIQSLTK